MVVVGAGLQVQHRDVAVVEVGAGVTGARRRGRLLVELAGGAEGRGGRRGRVDIGAPCGGHLGRRDHGCRLDDGEADHHVHHLRGARGEVPDGDVEVATVGPRVTAPT